MKKYVALFLMLSLLWMPGVYAAGIPAEQGLITDEAGLFSPQEAASLAETAQQDRYTFHVLTLDSLEGASAAGYASEVYTAWRLSARDILLLISSGDQQIELHFDNPGLQAYINTWSQSQGGSVGSAAITGLLDTYFIPYARNGDFAGGISSLMKQLNSMGSTQGSAGGSAGAGVNGSDRTDSSGNRGTLPANETGGLPFLTLAAVGIGIALVLLLLYILITGLRRRKQLASQQEQLADLLVRANHALESLQPFQGIVQGKTGEMVEGISKRLSAQLVEISALQSSGQSSLPPFYQLASLKAASARLQQTESTFRSALEEEEKKIAVIREADHNVKQRITELKQDAPELDGQLQDAVKETGYDLQEIVQDLHELAEETAKADQLELFDPIAAQDMTEDAQERQEQIELDLRDVETYDDKINDFPGVLAAARNKIAALIEQNSLQNMKIKPYETLEQAAAAATALEAPLRSGDMDEVRKIAAQLDSLLSEAIAMTERQALIRQNNHRDLEIIRSNWSVLTERKNQLQNQITEARIRFTEPDLSSLGQTLEEADKRLRQSAEEVTQIEIWTSDARGEYESARTGLDRLLGLQEATSSQFDGIAESLNALDERLNTVRRLFTEGHERVDSAQRLLHSRGLSSRSRFQLSMLPEFGMLEQRLTAQPYDLEELESLGRSYASQISSFVEEVNRLVRQREEEERQAQLALLREQQRREMARKRMSSGPSSTGGFGGGRSSGGGSWGGGGRSSGGSSWGGSGRSGGSKW